MQPRGLRSNNPGNLRATGDPWQGMTGQDADGFCIFDRPENGLRALCKVLLAYRDRHGLRTVAEIIARWAPPSENDTPAYVAAVARELGVAPTTPLAFDLPCLANLAAAITRHENGQQPYPRSVLEAGAAAALGVRDLSPVVGNPLNPQGDNSNGLSDKPDDKPSDRKEQSVLPAIIPAILPSIVSAIPVLAQIFGSGSEVAVRNQKAAQIVADTVVAATNSVNLQEAAEKIKSDDGARQAAQIAILAQPAIASLLEVGGGVKEARENDLRAMASDKPFWKSSPVFWISILMLPMVVWYVGSTIVGGIDIPSDWPWYAQLPLKLFGTAWSGDAKAGIANLVIGLVLGGICGVYYGVSVTQRNANDGKQAQ